MALLATKKGVRLERPGPDMLTIHYRHAAWNNDTTTVLGRNVEGGAKFTATGASSQWVKNRLNRALGIPGYGPPIPPPQSGPVGAKRVAQLMRLNIARRPCQCSATNPHRPRLWTTSSAWPTFMHAAFSQTKSSRRRKPACSAPNRELQRAVSALPDVVGERLAISFRRIKTARAACGDSHTFLSC